MNDALVISHYITQIVWGVMHGGASRSLLHHPCRRRVARGAAECGRSLIHRRGMKSISRGDYSPDMDAAVIEAAGGGHGSLLVARREPFRAIAQRAVGALTCATAIGRRHLNGGRLYLKRNGARNRRPTSAPDSGSRRRTRSACMRTGASTCPRGARKHATRRHHRTHRQTAVAAPDA